MSNEADEFGTRLGARRRAARLSQEELAERSGLSVRALRNLERGRTRWPHPDSVRRLTDALGLSGQERDDFISAAGRRLNGIPCDAAGTAAGGGPGFLRAAVPTAPDEEAACHLSCLAARKVLAIVAAMLDVSEAGDMVAGRECRPPLTPACADVADELRFRLDELLSDVATRSLADKSPAETTRMRMREANRGKRCC